MFTTATTNTADQKVLKDLGVLIDAIMLYTEFQASSMLRLEVIAFFCLQPLMIGREQGTIYSMNPKHASLKGLLVLYYLPPLLRNCSVRRVRNHLHQLILNTSIRNHMN